MKTLQASTRPAGGTRPACNLSRARHSPAEKPSFPDKNLGRLEIRHKNQSRLRVSARALIFERNRVASGVWRHLCRRGAVSTNETAPLDRFDLAVKTPPERRIRKDSSARLPPVSTSAQAPRALFFLFPHPTASPASSPRSPMASGQKPHSRPRPTSGIRQCCTDERYTHTKTCHHSLLDTEHADEEPPR